jgi:hypothetical protein
MMAATTVICQLGMPWKVDEDNMLSNAAERAESQVAAGKLFPSVRYL